MLSIAESDTDESQGFLMMQRYETPFKIGDAPEILRLDVAAPE
jgi:hypothetical protein